MANGLAGYKGSVNIGGAVGNVTQWTGEIRRELLDASIMNANAVKRYEYGLCDGRATIEVCFPDSGALPSIVSGSLATTTVSLTCTDGPTITGDFSYESVRVTVPVNGLVTYVMTGNIHGTITM